MTRATEAKAIHRIASELYHPMRNRRRALNKWHAEGRIVIQDNNDHVGVLLGTVNFWDKRGEFPSEKLFAQVALAVEAGQGFSSTVTIPTHDPKVPGALWNDSGVVRMSKGLLIDRKL